MCGDTHGDEHDQEIDPHREVGQPSEFLQRSDLAEKETGQGPDETTDGVAQLELRGFRESFSVRDDDDADTAYELN